MSNNETKNSNTDQPCDDDNIGNVAVPQGRGFNPYLAHWDELQPFEYAALPVGNSDSNIEGIGRGFNTPRLITDVDDTTPEDPPMPETSEEKPTPEPFNPWKVKVRSAGFLGDDLSTDKFNLSWIEAHVADSTFPMRVFPPKRKNAQADELLKMAEWLCGQTTVRQGRRPLGVRIGDWEATSILQPGRKGGPTGYELNVIPLTVEATGKMRRAFHQQFELMPAILSSKLKPIPTDIYVQLVEQVNFRHLRSPGIAILTILYNDRKALLNIHNVFTKYGKMAALELRKVIPETLVPHWPPAYQLEALLTGLYGLDEVKYLLGMLRETQVTKKTAAPVKEDGKSFAECLTRKV